MKKLMFVMLAIVAILVAIKFSPVIFLPILLALAVGLVGLLAVGALSLSLVAVALVAVLALAAVLSPIWIPVLLIAGIVWLVRKLIAKPVPAAA
jgi:hypothetical protein